MFDLNQILSAALNAAVAEAVAPLVERIAVLERRIDTLSSQHVAIGERLAALENNPAQGVDTTLTDRVVALEQRMDHVIDASEKRIREIAEAAAEQAMDNHCESYNHDDYDSVVSNWNDEDPADFLREGDLHDQIDDRVNETLRNATFSISI
jgi:hypothetical protein